MDKQENAQDVSVTAVQANPETGKSKFLKIYKERHPDLAGDPTDDDLWSMADEDYSGLQGRYNELNEANSRLAEMARNDPRFAAMLGLMGGEGKKGFLTALATVYGKDFLSGLEGKELDEIEAGDAEYMANQSRMREMEKSQMDNLAKYEENLTRFAADRSLTPEQTDQLTKGISTMALGMLNGEIPESVIELVYKGLNYDNDVQEAIDTGVVEGRNQTIEEKMRTHKQGEMPMLGGASGAGRKPKPRKSNDFFSALQ